MVNLHHPEVRYPEENQHFNWTMGGIQQYREEIAILTANGYTATTHDVKDFAGNDLIVTALYRMGRVVKVYML